MAFNKVYTNCILFICKIVLLRKICKTCNTFFIILQCKTVLLSKISNTSITCKICLTCKTNSDIMFIGKGVRRKMIIGKTFYSCVI